MHVGCTLLIVIDVSTVTPTIVVDYNYFEQQFCTSVWIIVRILLLKQVGLFSQVTYNFGFIKYPNTLCVILLLLDPE